MAEPIKDDFELYESGIDAFCFLKEWQTLHNHTFRTFLSNLFCTVKYFLHCLFHHHQILNSHSLLREGIKTLESLHHLINRYAYCCLNLSQFLMFTYNAIAVAERYGLSIIS